MTQMVPRVGDVWRFKMFSGRYTTKTITGIKLVDFRKRGWTSPKKGHPEGLVMCIEWSHRPKARYLGALSVRRLLSVRKGTFIRHDAFARERRTCLYRGMWRRSCDENEVFSLAEKCDLT